ncbi:hypothetical protein HR060_05450 [Catenovulum sp. SM1970]|uniref:hypothetical protein n=1 Tax=Marinifaba aquimaris TaxID=2741323 RepID=UPI0015739A7B|nr:hypothetical protein [Marinifaba aquimaris]NTS76309.1 hypothetical protein [Marinifaba aquimaris]
MDKRTHSTHKQSPHSVLKDESLSTTANVKFEDSRDPTMASANVEAARMAWLAKNKETDDS